MLLFFILSESLILLTANSFFIRALFGAFFYSTYIVLLRRKANHEDNMDAPMFFGFVGLFNAVLLWPGIDVFPYFEISNF